MESSFLDFLRDGFWHAAPILLVGMAGLVIIIERVRALFMIYPMRDMQGFFDQIRDAVMHDRTAEAVSLCDRYPGKPVAAVVKIALLRGHQPESLVENGLELVVEDASQKVQRRTGFLSMIGNVATLLGLFGTIAGLIAAFASIAQEDSQQKAALLALGISQAMYATMLGLGVAVPSMAAFSILQNRTNRLISDIETAALRIMDIYKQRYFEAEKSVVSGRIRGGQKTTHGIG